MISRLISYYKRRGFWETVRRTALSMRRTLFSNHEVLFYCDLSRPISLPHFSKLIKVEQKVSRSDLASQDVQQIIDVWDPKIARKRMEERFDKGASLWLTKFEGNLAGYGWTLRGRTIESHYFPMGEDDVHLFDFHVFPQYRGKGLNPLLVTYILRAVAADAGGRAFIEAAEWNLPQLSSLGRTPFRRLGCARKLTIFHRTIVCWPADGNASGIPVKPRNGKMVESEPSWSR